LRKSVLPDYYYFTLHRISWERSLESLLLCFIEEFGTQWGNTLSCVATAIYRDYDERAMMDLNRQDVLFIRH
jgi:hypothetical protein